MNILNNNEYDQEISQSQTADKPMARRGRATQQSRNRMDMKYCITKQNIEQLLAPTLGVPKNNESKTTNSPPYNGQQPKPAGGGGGGSGLKCILLVLILCP